MAIGARLSKKKSPVLRACANPNCEYAFWGIGNQKYCCKKCYKDVERPKISERTRKWRKNHPERAKEINKADYLKRKEKKNDNNN